MHALSCQVPSFVVLRMSGKPLYHLDLVICNLPFDMIAYPALYSFSCLVLVRVLFWSGICGPTFCCYCGAPVQFTARTQNLSQMAILARSYGKSLVQFGGPVRTCQSFK